jgi:predicted Zn-dependent protease with MMP-like domain
MRRDKFEAFVQQALLTIPARFRKRMRNLAIIVEDEPDARLLDDMEVPEGETLLGVYRGVPLTERTWDYGNRLPDQITLFQGPLERASEDEDDLVTAIGETLIHEVGHYFGLSEEELEAIEDQYWRERTGEVEEEDDDDGE